MFLSKGVLLESISLQVLRVGTSLDFFLTHMLLSDLAVFNVSGGMLLQVFVFILSYCFSKIYLSLSKLGSGELGICFWDAGNVPATKYSLKTVSRFFLEPIP